MLIPSICFLRPSHTHLTPHTTLLTLTLLLISNIPVLSHPPHILHIIVISLHTVVMLKWQDSITSQHLHVRREKGVCWVDWPSRQSPHTRTHRQAQSLIHIAHTYPTSLSLSCFPSYLQDPLIWLSIEEKCCFLYEIQKYAPKFILIPDILMKTNTGLYFVSFFH